MFKKSQGLSLNMIVVAVIVLIVLVVVISIFSGKMNFFQKGVRSCVSQGGHCNCYTGVDPDGKVNWVTPAKGASCAEKKDCPEGYGPIEGTDCNADDRRDNDLCCIKVF